MRAVAFPRSTSRGVLTCIADARVRRRIDATLLRARHPLHCAQSREECLSALTQDGDAIGTVIIGSAFARSTVVEGIIRHIAAEYPHIGILFLTDRTDRASIRAATLAGAHALLLRGVHDHGAALREQVNVATMEAARRASFCMLEPVLPARLHRFARRCLIDVDEGTTLTAIARRLRVTRQTLFNRCVTEGLCGPEELRSWCRMLLAAHMLCWTTWTAEQVSISLGFPSVTALRNAIKRHVGRTATELREDLGPARVLSALLRRLVTVERQAERDDAIAI